jgi:hypothetical protein
MDLLAYWRDHNHLSDISPARGVTLSRCAPIPPGASLRDARMQRAGKGGVGAEC